MFTIDEMLSKNNQRLALEHFNAKNDGCGPDGMRVSELEKYWQMNRKQIIEDLKNKEYQPGIIQIREYINKTGKRRNIASLNVIDRFIRMARALWQQCRKQKSMLSRDRGM